MNDEIERRLHRVMITSDRNEIRCPYSTECIESENCNRCNLYFHKCSKHTDFGLK